MEVENAIKRRLSPLPLTFMPEIGAVGYGVNHAFASPLGRLRVVESVETDESPEGAEIGPSPELIALFASVPDRIYQWWSLAGFEESMRIDGFDAITLHRHGERWVDEQRQIAAFLADKGRADDILLARDFNSLLDDINGICQRLNVDPHILLDGGAESIRAFVDDVPTTAVAHHLRRLRHRNPQHPWSQHDLADITSLCTAIPYCDVVVTEKQWAHLANIAKLGQRYNTFICSKLSDLDKWLESNTTTDG
ncbi:hypothetical protein [Actinomadura bangladeshensis]|uniref:Uncharacterized protein n=1 Tax=Actinomadura bangladeshensis TaxID=453573 RepID=A0A6L9QH30_9ACTN|nr:hypothetical protein [Actinomadura bangladeshensis]NEA24727.1 hypothetical protein [Actinomadura bangladeshensis]